MILQMWVKSKFVLCQPRYYNLLAEKKCKKIDVFEVMLFWRRTITVNLKKWASNAILHDFALSDSIILVEDLIRWNKGFEIILIDNYAGDIWIQNIASKY